MLKISAKSEYGMLALLYLTCHSAKGPVAVTTMAYDLDIPRRFLEQIVGEFKHRGLVQSLRGARGGYRLSKDPGSITMREIFRVTEGSFFQWTAASASPVCADVTPNLRVIRDAWTTLQGSVNDVLGSITLQQMCERAKRLQSDERAVAVAAGRAQ
jgi:Rrf2 family protein